MCLRILSLAARAVVASVVACILASATLPVSAEAQTTGPYEHVMEPIGGADSPIMGALSSLQSQAATFDPGDPRTGAPLLAAYAPGPLMLVDLAMADSPDRAAFNEVELIAGAVGCVASLVAFFDAVERDRGSDISFASIATAHAFSWNAQMLLRATRRMQLNRWDGPGIDDLPLFFAFPRYDGAGVGAQWVL